MYKYTHIKLTIQLKGFYLTHRVKCHKTTDNSAQHPTHSLQKFCSSIQLYSEDNTYNNCLVFHTVVATVSLSYHTN